MIILQKKGFMLRRLRAAFSCHGHWLTPILAALMIVAQTCSVTANMPGTFQPLLLAQAVTASTLSCAGGTITTAGGSRIHTFTASGTLTCTGSGIASYLIVGG